MTNQPIVKLLTFLLLVGGVALSLREVVPPEPVGRDAPADVFSAERAMDHVRALAQKPHPPGTEEHERVLQGLLSRIRALGLTPTVWEAQGLRMRIVDYVRLAWVKNVLVRVPGTGDGEKAVLLVSHYDSVATAPGAGDDMSGVATMLETMRALQASPPLENDVIFLFTDGEELGLLGAQAFVDRHPWKDDVGVVLNFEARGQRGTTSMFETSSGNREVIGVYADSVPDPATGSAFYEVYRRMPNDTDFTKFREAGLPGMNFAFLGGEVAYHTMEDTPEKLDAGSLQHHGGTALALVRAFGNRSLDPSELISTDEDSGRPLNAVYSSFFRSFVVHYPEWMALVLAAGGALILAFAMAAGVRRGRIGRGGFIRSFLSLLVLLAAAIGLTLALTSLFGLEEISKPERLRAVPTFSLGLLLIIFSLFSLVVRQWSEKVTMDEWFAGALGIWLIPAVALSIVVTGFSFLSTTAVLLGGLALWILVRRPRRARLSIPRLLIVFLLLLPVIARGSTWLYLVVDTLSLTGSVIAAAMLVLLLGVLSPLIVLLLTGRGWIVSFGSAAVGFVVLGSAVWQGGIDPDRPAWDTLVYARSAEAEEAYFASFDGDVDAYTMSYLGPEPERRQLIHLIPAAWNVLSREAEVYSLPAPSIRFLDEEERDGVRVCRVFFLPPLDAYRLFVMVDYGTAAYLLEANGQSVMSFEEARKRIANPGDEPPEGLWVNYVAPPEAGVELTLALPGGSPLPLTAISSHLGLPDSVSARPAYLIPRPNRPDETFVSISREY